jgi:hypothetical protein
MIQMDGKKRPNDTINLPYDEIPPKQQMPPCPNGCGNEEIARMKEDSPQLKDLLRGYPRLDSKVTIQYFFCKRCLALFVIKIKSEDLTGADNERLDLAA